MGVQLLPVGRRKKRTVSLELGEYCLMREFMVWQCWISVALFAPM